jgi:hypothetical protein
VACKLRQRIEPFQSSHVSSIPIARSKNLDDSIALTRLSY